MWDEFTYPFPTSTVQRVQMEGNHKSFTVFHAFSYNGLGANETTDKYVYVLPSPPNKKI